MFYGGRYRGFFGGGKVLGGKVQSPESRVQGPVQLLGNAIGQPVEDSMDSKS